MCDGRRWFYNGLGMDMLREAEKAKENCLDGSWGKCGGMGVRGESSYAFCIRSHGEEC